MQAKDVSESVLMWEGGGLLWDIEGILFYLQKEGPAEKRLGITALIIVIFYFKDFVAKIYMMCMKCSL